MTRSSHPLPRPDEHAPVYAAGVLTFDLKDTPALVASMKVVGTNSLLRKVARTPPSPRSHTAPSGTSTCTVFAFSTTPGTRTLSCPVGCGVPTAPRCRFPRVRHSRTRFPWGMANFFPTSCWSSATGRGLPTVLHQRSHAGKVSFSTSPAASIATTDAFRHHRRIFRLFLPDASGASDLVPFRASIEITFEARSYDDVAVTFLWCQRSSESFPHHGQRASRTSAGTNPWASSSRLTPLRFVQELMLSDAIPQRAVRTGTSPSSIDAPSERPSAARSGT